MIFSFSNFPDKKVYHVIKKIIKLVEVSSYLLPETDFHHILTAWIHKQIHILHQGTQCKALKNVYQIIKKQKRIRTHEEPM